MKPPKVSIITACLNAAVSIERTISSVAEQSYPNIEYIVIDGGSTDGTLKIINRHKRVVATLSSEPDKGISDAFNKGVKASTGDFILFLGAGDYLTDKNVLKEMMEGINPKTDMLVCGNIKRVTNDETEKVIYTTNIHFKRWHLLHKMALPHQALFTNKRFFEQYGLFDLNCKFAMDYELLLRAYHKFPKVIIKNPTVAAWPEGGVGKNRFNEIFDEYDRIRRKNRIAPFWLLWIIDKLTRLRYKNIAADRHKVKADYQKPDRVKWVDSAKAITVLAVVLGHIQSPFTNFIFSWHMPMFFFLSGMFTRKDKPLFPTIRKELYRLFIPFFAFAFLALGVEIAKRLYLPDYPFAYSDFSIRAELAGIFFWMDRSHMHHYGFLLWFLPALFWGRIISYLCQRYSRNNVLAIFIVLCLYFASARKIGILPFSLDKGILASIWVLLGSLYYQSLGNRNLRSIFPLALLLAYLLSNLPLLRLDIASNYFSSPQENLIYSLVMISVIVSLAQVSGYISNNRILGFIGRNSFSIFILHPYTNNVGYIISQSFFNSSWTAQYIISILFLITILLIIKYGKIIADTRFTHRLQPAGSNQAGL